MAQFCTKCGAPMGEGMKFCTGCGVVVGAAAAAAVPASPAPVAGPRPYAVQAGPAAAPGAKQGSPVMKIVLIVVAIIIFLMIISAASCAYMVYRAKQRVSQFEKQAQLTFPLPTGAGQAPSAPATAPGGAPSLGTLPSGGGSIPVYPGATLVEGGGALPMANVSIQAYSTSDSVDQVAAFYKEKLGAGQLVLGNNTGIGQAKAADGHLIGTLAFGLDSASGKTKITITTIGQSGGGQ